MSYWSREAQDEDPHWVRVGLRLPAADIDTFGPNKLAAFKVRTDELTEDSPGQLPP